MLEQRRLNRHKNSDNSGDGDLAEQFTLEIKQEIDQVELDFKQDIDIGTKELETKMAKLTEEHEEKVQASDNEELTNRLMADLATQQQALQDQHQRRMKAAYLARQAKLDAARRRRKQQVVEQSSSSDRSNDKDEIDRAIDSGMTANDAIITVLRKRHAKEQEELAIRQQLDKEAALSNALEKAEAERAEERKKLIADYQIKIADGEDEIEAEFTAALENFDRETNNIADGYYREGMNQLNLKHENQRMELLDRQLSEINDALTGYSNDAKLEKEREKREKEAEKKRKEKEKEMKEKSMTAEQLALEKQRAKYAKKRERLEIELKKEKDRQKEKDELERKKLEEMIQIQEQRVNQQLEEEKEQLVQSNTNQADQEKLMAEYEQRAKMMQQDQKLQSEKSRAALESRLANRRKARDEKEREQIETFDNAVKEANKPPAKQQPVKDVSKPEEKSAADHTTNNYANVLIESGLVNDLDYVSRVLSSSLKTQERSPILMTTLFKSDTNYRHGPITVVNPRRLTSTEFVSFRYCLHQLQQIQQFLAFEDIRIMVTESLRKFFKPLFILFF